MQFPLRNAAVILLATVVWSDARAASFSINDAISQAVLTNPGVGEASANRRATEAEFRQAQGTCAAAAARLAAWAPKNLISRSRPHSL